MGKEFQLIQEFFSHPLRHSEVTLGIGDDAAILTCQANKSLVVASDTLQAGVHFLDTWLPELIAERAMAVNISDFAAMGAKPAFMLLAISLPTYDEAWLSAFATGLQQQAERYGIDLIGGDTTRGPLSITLQLLGYANDKQSMRRSCARPGDGIYVTGYLGGAALGLAHQQGKEALSPALAKVCLQHLMTPTPRLQEGIALAEFAGAAIDISDGLAPDLHHIVQASKVGAVINEHAIPISDAMCQEIGREKSLEYALSGGDDYELCFTLKTEHEHQLAAISQTLDCPMTKIGEITAQNDFKIQTKAGQLKDLLPQGYQHF